MFYYYGRKKQLAGHYPSPAFDTIIEPFAGSAAYSLYRDHWKRNVLLVERDERVAEVWRWLIEDARPEELLKLPELKVGDRSSEFLHIIHAATKMAFAYKTIKITPVLARNWEISRRVMAANLHKVKHWKIVKGDYTNVPDIKATRFIDPPYKGAPGLGYKYSSKTLDYLELANWANTRSGEIICCEGNYGDYLPFEPLVLCKGVAGKISEERIYYRGPQYRKQISLFSCGGADSDMISDSLTSASSDSAPEAVV